MVSFYFVLSWTPQLLVSAGLDPKEGISGGVLLNLGGVVGALALGLLAARVGSFRIVSATMAAGALAMVAFALLAHGRNPAMAMALVVGYFIFGAMVGLYAILPAVYPTEVRERRRRARDWGGSLWSDRQSLPGGRDVGGRMEAVVGLPSLRHTAAGRRCGDGRSRSPS